MKKFVVVLVAAIIAVSNVSALKLGAFGGASLGVGQTTFSKDKEPETYFVWSIDEKYC